MSSRPQLENSHTLESVTLIGKLEDAIVSNLLLYVLVVGECP